jgi:hypothetical protein
MDICFSGLHGRAIEKKGSMKGIFFLDTRNSSKEHVARTFPVKSLFQENSFSYTRLTRKRPMRKPLKAVENHLIFRPPENDTNNGE